MMIDKLLKKKNQSNQKIFLFAEVEDLEIFQEQHAEFLLHLLLQETMEILLPNLKRKVQIEESMEFMIMLLI